LDPDPYPDPYWPPSGSTGSGSVKNEYGSETLIRRRIKGGTSLVNLKTRGRIRIGIGNADSDPSVKN
jgi:hypothetical protein